MLKWLKRILGVRIGSMNPIDPNKVTEFLNGWNTGRPADNPLWIDTTSTFALMQMDIADTGAVTFQGARGYPLKAFKNLETQEIRIFDARRFMQD